MTYYENIILDLLRQNKILVKENKDLSIMLEREREPVKHEINIAEKKIRLYENERRLGLEREENLKTKIRELEKQNKELEYYAKQLKMKYDPVRPMTENEKNGWGS
jgi:hypothetical protein